MRGQIAPDFKRYHSEKRDSANIVIHLNLYRTNNYRMVPTTKGIYCSFEEFKCGFVSCEGNIRQTVYIKTSGAVSCEGNIRQTVYIKTSGAIIFIV